MKWKFGRISSYYDHDCRFFQTAPDKMAKLHLKLPVFYAEIFMLTEEIHEEKVFHFRHLEMAKHDPEPCSRIKLFVVSKNQTRILKIVVNLPLTFHFTRSGSCFFISKSHVRVLGYYFYISGPNFSNIC